MVISINCLLHYTVVVIKINCCYNSYSFYKQNTGRQADIVTACNDQKLNKTPCNYDIVFGGICLKVHMCMLITMFLDLYYLQLRFMQYVIVPLLKSTSGDF